MITTPSAAPRTGNHLIDDLISLMPGDTQDSVGRYAAKMASVEDCLDTILIDPSDAPRDIAYYWQALNGWFSALDSFHAAEAGDPLADAFLACETDRYMAARRDLVEAIAAHYSPHFDNGANWDTGYYADPQAWIDGRGTTAVCFSNGIVDYGGAAGSALRARDAARHQAEPKRSGA